MKNASDVRIVVRETRTRTSTKGARHRAQVRREKRPWRRIGEWGRLKDSPFAGLAYKTVERRKLKNLPPIAGILARAIFDGPSTTVLLEHAGEVVAGSSRRCDGDRYNEEVGVALALSRALVILNDFLDRSKDPKGEVVLSFSIDPLALRSAASAELQEAV